MSSVNSTRPFKVFLCHAHSDKAVVRELYQRLTRDGVDAWLDKEKLLPGQDWEYEIRKAVREADVVVVCLSKQFNEAGFRQKEVKLTLDTAMEKPEGEIFIIPARLEECDTLESLRKWHWVDLFDENGYETLIRALHVRANSVGAALQEKRSWLPKVLIPGKAGEFVVEKESATPRAQKSKSSQKPNTPILVALISFVGIIMAGLLALPLIEKWFSSLSIETELATETFTVTSQSVIASHTLEPSLTPNEGIPPISTIISTPTVVPIVGEWLLDFDWQCDGKDIGHNLLVFSSNRTLVSFMGTSTTIAGRGTWRSDGVNITWKYPDITYVGKVTDGKMSGTMGNTSCWTAQSVTSPPTETTDDFGVEMVLVPSGEFAMGSVDGNADERPVHTVFLSSFYIDKYEVTNSHYSACVRAGVCQPPIVNGSQTRPDYYGNPEFNNYPVIYVNLNMAKTYCAWRDARLPTEAEWEKAARGADGRTYPWGENISCDYLNFNKCVGDTTPVGSYEIGKSIYGLYDMAGNVWEWVSDWYDEYYYSISPFENPKGSPISSGSLAVVRGGSWSGGTEFTSRLTNRASRSPDKTDVFIGFRCARGVNP